MEIYITRMSPAHREEIVSIYNSGVEAGDMMLDTDNPGCTSLSEGFVAKSEGIVVGWAATSRIESGSVPPGVARISVYVAPDFRRKGIGRTLLNAIIDHSSRSGINTLLSDIVPENVPALLLHKQCGFKAIGMVQQAGQARGQWQDAVLLKYSCA